MSDLILELEDLSFSYKGNDSAKGYGIKLESLSLKKGQTAAITGVSGCGKSTLLECLGLIRNDFLVKSFNLDSIDIANSSIAKRRLIRSSVMSYMPQTGGLIPYLSIEDNISLKIKASNAALKALKMSVTSEKELFKRAIDLSEIFGLSDRLKYLPESLSIGQRQRAVFFKTICTAPALILIDEPTSSLDPEHSQILFDTIIKSCSCTNTSALVVSHDVSLVKKYSLANLSYQPGQNNDGVFCMEAV